MTDGAQPLVLSFLPHGLWNRLAQHIGIGKERIQAHIRSPSTVMMDILRIPSSVDTIIVDGEFRL